MTHCLHRLRRLRIPNQHICAVIAIILILRSLAFGTVLLVLVSGNVIVFGADGKGVGSFFSNMIPITTFQSIKVITLQDRFLISSSGAGEITRGDRIIYSFESMVKSIPVTNKSSTRDVADMISSACWPIFSDEWDHLSKTTKGPLRPFNLADDPSLPIVSYFIGGSEFLGPEVYLVEIHANWKKQHLQKPVVTQKHPPDESNQRRNLFAFFKSGKGGGIQQLTTQDGALQRKYLKLYDKEIGALVFDEPLDRDSLLRLGRIMVTAEIDITPKSYDFPIEICSLGRGLRAACNTYDKQQ